MPPPKLLADARPIGFVGEFVEPLVSGEGVVPLVDIYEGTASQAGQKALDGSDVHVYEFMPLAGDELDAIGQPFAVAALEGVHRLRNGHVAGWLSFAVSGPETTSHTTSPNPVIEGAGRFRQLMHVLTAGDDVDRLYMLAENTNLTPDELKSLGFQAVAEVSDVLLLELPADRRSSGANVATAPAV